jgi:hypothetical protein
MCTSIDAAMTHTLAVDQNLLAILQLFFFSMFSLWVYMTQRDRNLHDYATIVHSRPAFGTAISNDRTSHMDWGSRDEFLGVGFDLPTACKTNLVVTYLHIGYYLSILYQNNIVVSLSCTYTP